MSDDILDRRTLLQAAAGCAATATMGALPVRAQQPRPGPGSAGARPNIVFIMADDLGYADVGCYGRRDISTPNIDRIAEQGVRFLQAYANSSVCSATRTALITGRYQYRLECGLEEPIATRNIGLPPGHPTLPSLLHGAGYATALLGKWHLGRLPQYGPLRSGYDHFFGFRGGTLDYYSHRGSNGQKDLWDGDVPAEETAYLTDLLGQRGEEMVGRFKQADRPFLLSLHFNAPHWPWEAPGDRAESERLRAAGGASLRHFDGGTQATYKRMVEAMDAQIGRVLAAVDANGIAQDTIVVFTSDNGGERFSDTWPFTGRKTELLEGGLRIPAVIRWPARIPPGRMSDQVAITMDWVPTLLAAAATSAAPGYPSDGMDLLPTLTGDAAPIPRKLFWRYKAHAQRAMRDGNWKYLKIRDNTFLFDVAEDPQERANLKARRKDVFDRLEAEWLAWNRTMLPETDESETDAFRASQLADHIGVDAVPSKADNPP